MSGTAAVGIEPLAKRHDRRAFSCGVEALDVYLKRFARQHAETNISRTYVAISGSTVVGFYSLAMSGIRRENLPEKYLTRFPNFPLPVTRLARLAVGLKHQGPRRTAAGRRAAALPARIGVDRHARGDGRCQGCAGTRLVRAL